MLLHVVAWAHRDTQCRMSPTLLDLFCLQLDHKLICHVDACNFKTATLFRRAITSLGTQPERHSHPAVPHVGHGLQAGVGAAGSCARSSLQGSPHSTRARGHLTLKSKARVLSTGRTLSLGCKRSGLGLTASRVASRRTGCRHGGAVARGHGAAVVALEPERRGRLWRGSGGQGHQGHVLEQRCVTLAASRVPPPPYFRAALPLPLLAAGTPHLRPLPFQPLCQATLSSSSFWQGRRWARRSP